MRTRTLYVIYGILSGLLFIALILPSDERWLIPCPLFRLTGWQCPLCGGQRLIRCLSHGDLLSAWHHNPALMCALPLLILWGLRSFFPKFAIRHPRLTLAPLFTGRALLVYLALALFWGIVRNIW